MELNEFAEAVLMGASVDDKLLVPTRFTDAGPRYTRAVPDAPARDRRIAFAAREERLRFPKASTLGHPDGRAATLHFFANHELMALELMALSLLRFQDAPTEFRMGIAYTMLDEQRHFRGYRDRVRALGMDFGDLPLSAFFWDALSGLRQPIDYLTQLSLTFEQANLDFAKHYRDLFLTHGDAESAGVLQSIYDDEISHVAFGVRWFERMRAPGPSLWEAYRDALPEPLSPSRAKGIGFTEAGRRAAGLPEDFIRQLQVYSRSKGAPARLFCFNAATPASDERHDLAYLATYFAGVSDIAVVPPQRLEFLERQRAAGFQPPELVAPEDVVETLASRRHLRDVHLHQRTERARRLIVDLHDRLMNTMSAEEGALSALEAPDRLAALAEGLVPATPWKDPGDDEARARFSLHFDTATSGHRFRITRAVDLAPGVAAWCVGRPWDGAADAVVRFLHENPPGGGRSPLRLMRALTFRVRAHLLDAGYKGPAALDFVATASDEGVGRWGLGGLRLGLTLDSVAATVSRVASGPGTPIWFHLGPAAGATYPRQTWARLSAIEGAWLLPTNDPETARAHLTALYVGEPGALAAAITAGSSEGTEGRRGRGGGRSGRWQQETRAARR